ncbi:MAG: hypothetical protein IT535_00880 [Bauldia sp.]|nr:hypothetical protein [Bauldia sp.]
MTLMIAAAPCSTARVLASKRPARSLAEWLRPAGHEGAVDDGDLALEVAADEIGLGADADPDGLGGQALGLHRVGDREGGGEVDGRPAAAGVADLPVGRPPVVRQLVGEVLDGEAEALEPLGDEGHRLAVGIGARQAAPVFVAGDVAVTERDLREGDDVLLHPVAVDRGIGLLVRRQRPEGILIVGEEQRVGVTRQAEAVGGLDLRPELGDLRQGRGNAGRLDQRPDSKDRGEPLQAGRPFECVHDFLPGWFSVCGVTYDPRCMRIWIVGRRPRFGVAPAPRPLSLGRRRTSGSLTPVLPVPFGQWKKPLRPPVGNLCRAIGSLTRMESFVGGYLLPGHRPSFGQKRQSLR